MHSEEVKQFLALIVGPFGAVVALSLWIASLRSTVKDLNGSVKDLHRRNETLSQQLVQTTESHWRERAKREETHMLLHDSSNRNTLASLEAVLKAMLGELVNWRAK